MLKISVLAVKIVANKAANRTISTRKSDVLFDIYTLTKMLSYLGNAYSPDRRNFTNVSTISARAIMSWCSIHQEISPRFI